MSTAAAPRPALPPRTEVARKTLHLLAATVPLAWAFELVTAVEIRVASAGLAATALLLEALRFSVPAVQRFIDALVGPMLRPAERRTLTGATWLALAIAVAAFALPARAAIAALWAVAVGDAFAALIGGAGRPSGTDRGKTMRGSITCALASAAGAWWLAGAPVLAAAIIGTAAAVAERPRISLDDNIRITLAAGLTAWALGVA